MRKASELMEQTAERWVHRHLVAIEFAMKDYDLQIGVFTNAGVIDPEKRAAIDTLFREGISQMLNRVAPETIDLSSEAITIPIDIAGLTPNS
jgi:hypothetical protein